MNKLLSHILIGTLIMFISACVSSESRVNDLVQNLPFPDGATLIYSSTGQGQGSQDACFATFFYGLYGTDKSYDEVAAFYEEHLTENKWQRVHLDWRPNNGLFFEQDSGFRLYIETEVNVNDIPEDTIKIAQTQHKTLYLIVVTYRDWLARTYC